MHSTKCRSCFCLEFETRRHLTLCCTLSRVHRMLDEFSHEMESTQSRLDTTLRKMAKLSRMTNGTLVTPLIGYIHF